MPEAGSSRLVIDRLTPNGQTPLQPSPYPTQPLEFIDKGLSMLSNTMVTKADLEASQELQDKGIRLEFKNVHQRFDKIDEQFKDVDKRFNTVDERFNKVDERFKDVDKRFDKMDERFKEMDDKMDERFNKVDEQFGDMMERFESRFYNIEARTTNYRASDSWDTIVPLGFFESSKELKGNFVVPKKFPGKVAKFWHLKAPRNIPQLVELVEFYKIQGWQNWGSIHEENDDSDDDDPSQHYSTVNDAVSANPEIALERLASYLGLMYSRIKQKMKLKEDVDWLHAHVESKRKAVELGKDQEREEKRRQPKLERPSPPTPKNVLSLEMLFPEEPKVELPSQPSTQLGWDPRISSASSDAQNSAKEDNSKSPVKTPKNSKKSSRHSQGSTVSSKPKTGERPIPSKGEAKERTKGSQKRSGG